MPEYKFKFRNSGKDQFNDVVFDGEPFFLPDAAFEFTILPKQTQFWRFGIRLSSSPDIPFFHPVYRHREGIIDIHISVGEMIDDQWTNPTRFEIGQYHIPNAEQILSRSNSYRPMSMVTWRMQLLEGYEDQNFLAVEYEAMGVTAFRNRVIIPATYKYFQVFAWSDKNEFDLDCTIRVYPNQKRIKQEDSAQNYWLLKINPQSFKIPQFKEGQEIWFGTHDTKFAEREEYELYSQVKPGDAILGYAFKPHEEIIWDMTADVGVHSDKNYGECIKMSIDEVITPGIPIDSFESILPPEVHRALTNRSSIRLIAISSQIYYSILTKSASPRRKKTCYYPSYRTEGDHKKTPDQLQLEYDIEALASVIALKEVNPPLAVGLFGNWGSGKSFFMEKLELKIAEYASNSKGPYVKHVVPVRFNSWHYCDTNLWASLITQIFESLKKFSKDEGQEEQLTRLVDTLQITTLQKDVAVEARKKLEEKVEHLIQQREKDRSELKDISGVKLLKLILSDKHIKQDLSKLQDENIDKIVTDGQEVERYIKELDSSWNKARYFIRELFNLNGWRWFLVISFAIIVFVLAFVLTKLFPEVWTRITTWGAVTVAGVAATVARIRSVLKPVKENLDEAVRRLTNLKSTIEAREKVDPHELTQKQREIEDLRNSILQLDIKIDQTQINIQDIITGKRLGDFIDKRSKDEEYAKGLGMISWIRKDFDILDKLLREQYELTDEERGKLSNPQDVKLKIDRIVLYIDDLDRCNEDVVVKVLEAIHLLLAFPLFVVIVGVDPRWLNNALKSKLGKLFSSETKAVENGNVLPEAKAVTSYDYLEKIFQIPFALKPISETGREKLIDFLLPANFEAQNVTPATHVSNETPYADAEEPIFSDNRPLLMPIPDEQPAGRVKLSFKSEEIAFIKKLSVIFGQTPRSIKRFVNVYMIIKSHRSLVVKNSDGYKDYYPVIVMLAIVVGCSENAARVVKMIIAADDYQLLDDFIDSTTKDPNAKDLKEMLLKFKQLFSPEVSRVSMADFKANAELVSRFSFRQILE